MKSLLKTADLVLASISKHGTKNKTLMLFTNKQIRILDFNIVVIAAQYIYILLVLIQHDAARFTEAN